jgi:hypothetical protein
MVTAAIIATGASLKQHDVDLCHRPGWIVYAVNDAYLMAPNADFLYACDKDWWDIHEKETRLIKSRWSCNQDASIQYGLEFIRGHHARLPNRLFGVKDDIVYGGNSGFQTLNLAYLHGIRRAVLLGFDMGGSHFFGEHPKGLNRNSPFKMWIDHFKDAAPEISAAGMQVINCTMGGALECFPRMKINEVPT